jgi:hypothetical protein
LSKRDKKYSVFDYNIELFLIVIVIVLLETLRNKNMTKYVWYISGVFAIFMIYLYIHKVFVAKESFADVTTSPVTPDPTSIMYTTTPVVKSSFFGSVMNWFSSLFSKKTSTPQPTDLPITDLPTTALPTTFSPMDMPMMPPMMPPMQPMDMPPMPPMPPMS